MPTVSEDGMNYNGTKDFLNEENMDTRFKIVKAGYMWNIYNNGLVSGVNSNTNAMKQTEYLLDSTNWTKYENEYAEYAIGGATPELIGLSLVSGVDRNLASWNGSRL